MRGKTGEQYALDPCSVSEIRTSSFGRPTSSFITGSAAVCRTTDSYMPKGKNKKRNLHLNELHKYTPVIFFINLQLEVEWLDKKTKASSLKSVVESGKNSF